MSSLDDVRWIIALMARYDELLPTPTVIPMCSVCWSRERLTLDHIVPSVRGGPNTPDNLQILCLSCNSAKHDKEMSEWLFRVNTSGDKTPRNIRERRRANRIALLRETMPL